MGNAAFIFYSGDSTRGATVIDFGRGPTDFFWEPVRKRSGGWTLAGDMFSTVQSGRHRVSITLGPFNNTGAQLNLERKLESMSSHLERGLPVSFAADLDKAWGGFIPGTMRAGTKTLTTNGNLFNSYASGIALAAGDELVIEGPNPTHHREIMEVASESFGVITTQNPTLYNYNSGPIMVRHRKFYPVLYLDKDDLNENLITNDHRWTFTLSIVLHQGVEAFASMYSNEGAQADLAEPNDTGDDVASSRDAAGATLQGLISNGRRNTSNLGSDYSFDPSSFGGLVEPFDWGV